MTDSIPQVCRGATPLRWPDAARHSPPPDVGRAVADALEPVSAPPLDLPARWQKARVVRVGDGTLKAAVPTLLRYHIDHGFFGPVFDDMALVTGRDPRNPGFEIRFRPSLLADRGLSEKKSECALGDPSFVDERGLGWRDWVIWPNAYPYGPMASQHVVITAATHLPQETFSREIVEEMLDFQRIVRGDNPLTLVFNGLAGNSQKHLHWHAIRETLPLERLLDEGALSLSPMRVGKRPSDAVSTFDDGFFAGVLVTGSRGYVAEQAQQIVRELEGSPLTEGHYNVLVLNPRAGQHRLVIIPRRPGSGRADMPPHGWIGIAAFAVAGRLVTVDRVDDPAYFAAAADAVRASIVTPAELGWTSRRSSTGTD